MPKRLIESRLMLLREERWIPDWIDSVKKKRYTQLFLVGSFMMLNTTFNNISLISPITVECTTNSTHNLLNTNETTTFSYGNRCPGMGQVQNCGWVKPI
jgi:hypothetical protein